MNKPGSQCLRISDGSEWSFLGGSWTDSSDGAIVPPDEGGKEYMAVLRERDYSDFEARFRFRFRFHYGSARFLFRVQDSSRYYALEIPWGGQQCMARHFWAGIVRADGTPLQKYLHLGLVPGVCPEQQRWYEGRVECKGSRIRAWIEGRPVADIEDHAYATGRVGLMGTVTAGNGSPHFMDLEVTGTTVAPSPWPGLAPIPKHWITPCPEVDPQTHQGIPTLLRDDSGVITLSVPFCNPNVVAEHDNPRVVWVRSSDGGQTWSEPEPSTIPPGPGRTGMFGAPFVKRNGNWVCVYCKEEGKPEDALYSIESPDKGKTWTEPRPLRIVGDWPSDFTLPAWVNWLMPLRLRDGALLFCADLEVKSPDRNQSVWTNFVFRSSDDGETWNAPVRCDRRNPLTPRDTSWFCPGDFNEISLAETSDNVIVGIGRPWDQPFMWQLRSSDGGRSWEPAAYAPFPGYCNSLTRTASGALVVVKRFPHLSACVSYDDGVTWDAGTIIDYPAWANHKALEVEPDVVLVVYMGHIVEPGQPDMRAVRLRVTENGLVMDNQMQKAGCGTE